MDCHFLLQGIFPTQGPNLGLLNCRQIPYLLSHQGRLMMLDVMEKPNELSGQPNVIASVQRCVPLTLVLISRFFHPQSYSFRPPYVSPRPWHHLLTGLPAPVWPSSPSPVCSLGAQVCLCHSSAQQPSVAPHCPKEGVHRKGHYFSDPSYLSLHPTDVHHTHVQHTPGPLHRQAPSLESPLPACQARCDPCADHTPGAVLSTLCE